MLILFQTVDYLLKLNSGDLRRSITMLQCVSQLTNKLEPILPTHLEEAASVVPTSLIENLLKTIKNGNFDDMQTTIKVKKIT